VVDSVIEMAHTVTYRCRRLITPRADHQPGELEVQDGKVRYAGFPRARGGGAIEIDGVVCPGLIDLQVNGWGKHSVLDGSPSSILAISAKLLAHGVTGWLPTIVSAPEANRLAALDAIEQARSEESGGARVLGAHLEGPWISPARPGAHNPQHLVRPDELALARSLDRRGGLVRMVTIAPELPGGTEAVGQITKSGALAAIGHSDASFDEARASFNAGVRVATHLWNAMRPFHHRDPGVTTAVLTDQRVTAGLIADGTHVNLAGLLLAFRTKGPARIALVSDLVEGGSDGLDASRRSDGKLAGALTGLAASIAVCLSAGIGLVDAIQSATLVPAGLLGLPSGRLDPKSPADFVVFDDELVLRSTYIAGREAWRS
jgi:N-acetylglucosamine-6-phosphate deacetylase